MDKGKMILKVTKEVENNGNWYVFVDGRYVDRISYEHSLRMDLPKGVHTVQYKMGTQSTKILDVNISDEEVTVECVYDGTLNRFACIDNPVCVVNTDEPITYTQTENKEDLNKKLWYQREVVWVNIATVVLSAILIFFCISLFSKSEKKNEQDNIDNQSISTNKIEREMGRFIDDFNKFYKDNLVNEDTESYEYLLNNVFCLEPDYFLVSELDEDSYIATYSADGVDLFSVMLFMNEKQEIAEVRVGTNHSTHPDGVEGAFDVLRVVSYGCISAANDKMNYDEITELFKSTCMDIGYVNEYKGVEYYAAETEEIFTFIITLDEELFIGEIPIEDRETSANQNIETNKDVSNTTDTETEKETTKKEHSEEKQTTSKKETAEETTSKNQTSNNIVKLSNFTDYNNIIVPESNKKYKVQFDGEVFDMSISNWTTSYRETLNSSIWYEDNVAVTNDFATDPNGYYDIFIYAFDDYFACEKLMNEGAHQVQISLKCASNKNYKYDVENTKELYDFVITVAEKMLDKYPVDEGISLSKFTDYSSVFEDGNNQKYRVQFDGEVFDMSISNWTTSYRETLNSSIWYEDNVAVKKNFFTDPNGYYDIFIYAFDDYFACEKLMNEGAHEVKISLKCASNKNYKYDVENTKELYDFVITVAKKMLDKYPVE